MATELKTYHDCLDFLFARNQFSIKLGLDNICSLLEAIGNPQLKQKYIHVAGTNGKGSVCNNIAKALPMLQYQKVGLYTSPHLVSFRERITINGEPISKAWILQWMQKFVPLILKLQATYFECVTALALDYFRSENCDVVVLETGLGGRLDATNAVTPQLTVITSISLDHTAILGDSLEKIIVEKLGILKTGIPLIINEGRENLKWLIDEAAQALQVPVYNLADPATFPKASDKFLQKYAGIYATYELPKNFRPEKHQQENLHLSLIALENIKGGALNLNTELQEALAKAPVYGRTQLLQAPGLRPVLLDGAHNPEGMERLAEYIQQAFPQQKPVSIFAIMKDKDLSSIRESLFAFSEQVFFASLLKYSRALTSEDWLAQLSASLREKNSSLVLSDKNLLSLLKDPEAVQAQTPLIICGSLYLLGEVIPLLLPHYAGLEYFAQFAGENEL